MKYKFIFTRAGFGIRIDEEDYSFLSQYTWYISKDGYARARIGPTIVAMHRLLAEARDRKIDHTNGVRHDNRKSNLRPCTQAENLRNRRLGNSNTSGFKGVTKNRTRKAWTAQIKYEDKYYYLGSFKTRKEAAIAYDQKAIELHKEFANLNFRRTE